MFYETSMGKVPSHHGQKERSGTQTERQNEDIDCDEKKSTFSFRARKVDTFHSAEFSSKEVHWTDLAWNYFCAFAKLLLSLHVCNF